MSGVPAARQCTLAVLVDAQPVTAVDMEVAAGTVINA
jgi:hypothetical protein